MKPVALTGMIGRSVEREAAGESRRGVGGKATEVTGKLETS